MEYEGLIPCSQQPVANLCPERAKFNPRPPIIYFYDLV